MKSSHPSVYFNSILVSSTSVHKHLGMLLDDKLSYEHHLKSVLNKVKKTIRLLHKFQQILPWQSLIAIYKSFIRPHLEYGDVWNYLVQRCHIDNWSNKRYIFWETFSRIRLRILKIKMLVKKIVYFTKCFIKKFPLYLFQLIPPNNNVYATRSSQSNKIYGTSMQIWKSQYIFLFT